MSGKIVKIFLLKYLMMSICFLGVFFHRTKQLVFKLENCFSFPNTFECAIATHTNTYIIFGEQGFYWLTLKREKHTRKLKITDKVSKLPVQTQ